MAAPDIEIILNRQLADCLSVPVFIVDPIGTLLFFNEPAEKLLGSRFDDTGELKVEEWSTMFTPLDDKGDVIPPEKLPLVMTLNSKRPAHKSFWIKNLNGEKYKISATTYPIIGRSKRFSGAVALFWKHNEDS